MALFGLFGSKKPFEFDETEGHPHVRAGVEAVKRGDSVALLTLYRQQMPAGRVPFIDGIGRLGEIGQGLEVTEDTDSQVIDGALRYLWAHRLRGFGTGDTVSQKAAFSMREMAVQAYDRLKAVRETAPEDSVCAAFFIRTLMLLGRGTQEEFVGVETSLIQSEAPNVYALMAALNFRTPKWYGSDAQMHLLADAAAGREQAALMGLKARAHIESWLFAVGMSDDVRLKDAFLAKMRTLAFKASLAQIDDAFWKKRKAGQEDAASLASAHNQFGFLFSVFFDAERAKPHLEMVGRCPFEVPWCYASGNSIPAYVNEKRAQAGLRRL